MPASLVLLSLLAVPQGTAGTTPTVVRGQVVNSRTLVPVADALVALVEIAVSQRTTPTGHFEFPNVAPGTYTLTVSTVGYIFVRRTITVQADVPAALTVPIAEGTGTYEESVDVTATASSEASVSAVTVSSAALQDLRDTAADDPVRAMQALPGVATGDDFRAQFSVRGSAFRHVGIVIDSSATSLLFHTMGGVEDPGSIAMINTDVLERATLSTGIHPQEHGNWIGATLAFDVREGSRDRRGVRVAVSGTSASIVSEGPLGRTRRGSWLISVRKSYVDWLIRRIDPQIESTIGFVDTQAKVGYDLTPRQHLTVLAVGGRASYEKPTATGANQVHRARSASALASIGWRYTRDRWTAAERLTFVTNETLVTGKLAQAQADGRTRSWTWRTDATAFANTAWRVDTGTTVERVWLSQALRDFRTLSDGSLQVRTERTIDRRRTIAGGWAQIGHRSAEGAMTGGIRVSADSATHASRVSPWLVVERPLTPQLQIVGGIGQAHQFPTLAEMGHGLEPIEPEAAWGVDVGVVHQVTPATRWRVGVFRRDESNILRQIEEDRIVDGERVTGTPFVLLGSNLEGHAQGVDLLLERHAGTGLVGWIGYSWSHLRDRDRRTGEVFDGDFDQRHTLNVFLQQRVSYRMKVATKLRVGSNFPIVGYFSGTPDALVLSDERNQVRLPVYARLDLSGSRTFTYRRSRLTVFLELLNVLGRQNLGPGNGSIRSNLTAVNYTESLLPFVPSVGMLLEF